MKVIDNENIRPFDVDGTLIDNGYKWESGAEYVYVKDSITNKEIRCKVNRSMVRLLKEESSRGNYVVVWSRSGKEWAKNVILALKLKAYVKLVMAKPLVYFDDLPVEQWLKDRVFIDGNSNYKR